jgi:hypothetical protein
MLLNNIFYLSDSSTFMPNSELPADVLHLRRLRGCEYVSLSLLHCVDTGSGSHSELTSAHDDKISAAWSSLCASD